MLFKVWNTTSGLKKAVFAEKFDSLKEKGCDKLSLPGDVDDGKEIGDDDWIQNLPNGSILYFLRNIDEKHWMMQESKAMIDTWTSGDIDVVASTSYVTHQSGSTNLRILPLPMHFNIPENNFSSDLKEALETGGLTWILKAELLTHLSTEIFKYTDNPNSSERRDVAIALISKYPQLKSRIYNGYHGWETRIYDKIREVRRKQKHNELSLVPNKKLKVTKNLPIRRRGEINWSPPFPDGEDRTSLKAVEEWMKSEDKKDPASRNKDLIKANMKLCFALRRELINSNITLSRLKYSYPFLFSVEGKLEEFNTLMNIDAKQTFISELYANADYIIHIAQKKKSPQIYVILDDFTINSKSLNVNKRIILPILLLPLLLGESNEYLYENHPPEINIDDISVSGILTPRVIVFGSPFESAEITIIGENNIIVESRDFVEAVIATFALYYACNIKYPDQGQCSYLFMSIHFLKLKECRSVPRKLGTLIDRLELMKNNKMK